MEKCCETCIREMVVTREAVGHHIQGSRNPLAVEHTVVFDHEGCSGPCQVEVERLTVREVGFSEPACGSSAVSLALDAGEGRQGGIGGFNCNGPVAGSKLQGIEGGTASQFQWDLPPPGKSCINVVTTNSMFTGIRTEAVRSFPKCNEIHADANVGLIQEGNPEAEVLAGVSAEGDATAATALSNLLGCADAAQEVSGLWDDEAYMVQTPNKGLQLLAVGTLFVEDGCNVTRPGSMLVWWELDGEAAGVKHPPKN